MVYNDKCLNNLKSFKKGETANPSGRPKGLMIWSYIRKHTDKSKAELTTIINDDNSKARDVIACQYLLRALNGDIRATEYLIDREDGKPTTNSNITADVLGLQFIGQSGVINNELVQSIQSTVIEASSAKASLMSSMNQAIGVAPVDTRLEEGDHTPPPDTDTANGEGIANLHKPNNSSVDPYIQSIISPLTYGSESKTPESNNSTIALSQHTKNIINIIGDDNE